jgi:hypothetical protein
VQFVIDPAGPRSDRLRAAVLELVEQRPDLVRRPGRCRFLVPSWTRPGLDHEVVLVFAGSGWRASCSCEALRACKHGYAAATVAERQDGTEAPTPTAKEPADAA